jgi:hypothetical protein
VRPAERHQHGPPDGPGQRRRAAPRIAATASPAPATTAVPTVQIAASCRPDGWPSPGRGAERTVLPGRAGSLVASFVASAGRGRGENRDGPGSGIVEVERVVRVERGVLQLERLPARPAAGELAGPRPVVDHPLPVCPV